ncbi:MAG: hypothetical protein LRZ84_21915 [Desertifilum sp.]|nr:hypothetical protein [Desertifilum sp.]
MGSAIAFKKDWKRDRIQERLEARSPLPYFHTLKYFTIGADMAKNGKYCHNR